MKFPKVVAAVAAMEKCQWRIGDALLEEVPMGKPGVNNDRYDAIDECREELEEQGFIISHRSLTDYRWVAAAFKTHERVIGVSWDAHRRAGSPEMLAAIRKITGKKKMSSDLVLQTKEIVHQHQAREYREEQRKLGVEPKKTPKFLPKPTIRQEHMGGLRLMAEVLRHVGHLEDARTYIETATVFVRENLTKLDAEDTEYFTGVAFEIAKLGHKLGDVAQRLADRRKRHLSVVGE